MTKRGAMVIVYVNLEKNIAEHYYAFTYFLGMYNFHFSCWEVVTASL